MSLPSRLTIGVLLGVVARLREHLGLPGKKHLPEGEQSTSPGASTNCSIFLGESTWRISPKSEGGQPIQYTLKANHTYNFSRMCAPCDDSYRFRLALNLTPCHKHTPRVVPTSLHSTSFFPGDDTQSSPENPCFPSIKELQDQAGKLDQLLPDNL